MWILFLSLVVLMCTGAAGTGEAVDRCTCAQVRHPQDLFCTSDFAYRVRIQSAGPSQTPGEPDMQSLYYPFWKYEAVILETFKDAPQMPTLEEGDVAEFYTPDIALCSKKALYKDGHDDYVMSGYVTNTYNDVYYMGITICSWVELWSDVTKGQKMGLRGAYSNCSCKIFPASGGLLLNKLPQDKFRMEECLFNPVSAQVLGVIDCEKLHGFCIHSEDNTCTWASSKLYRECFQSRRLLLSQNAKPAVMSRGNCDVYTGRKRKQCLLKFLKSRRRGS